MPTHLISIIPPGIPVALTECAEQSEGSEPVPEGGAEVHRSTGMEDKAQMSMVEGEADASTAMDARDWDALWASATPHAPSGAGGMLGLVAGDADHPGEGDECAGVCLCAFCVSLDLSLSLSLSLSLNEMCTCITADVEGLISDETLGAVMTEMNGLVCSLQQLAAVGDAGGDSDANDNESKADSEESMEELVEPSDDESGNEFEDYRGNINDNGDSVDEGSDDSDEDEASPINVEMSLADGVGPYVDPFSGAVDSSAPIQLAAIDGHPGMFSVSLPEQGAVAAPSSSAVDSSSPIQLAASDGHPGMSSASRPERCAVAAPSSVRRTKQCAVAGPSSAMAQVVRNVKRAARAAVTITPKVSALNEHDLDGNTRAYSQGSLKQDLWQIKTHCESHLGFGHSISKLAHIAEAHKQTKLTMEPDTSHRALSLHDDLQTEGWQCFDPAYAADRFMMGLTGKAEKAGPRASDVFAARRSHYSKVAPTIIKKAAWKWRRYSGKSNRIGKRRTRMFTCAKGCKRSTAEGRTQYTAEQAMVEYDPELEMLLPETRCGACAMEALFDLADCDGTNDEQRPAFRGLAHKAKFSWEKHSKPMTRRADGSYDGTGWFKKRPMECAALNLRFRSWGKEINRRRRAMDPLAPQLLLSLFRSHSMRHGCVFNLKRSGVDPGDGAAHVCMSRYMWDNVYGLEDAEVVGERITGELVGMAAHP